MEIYPLALSNYDKRLGKSHAFNYTRVCLGPIRALLLCSPEPYEWRQALRSYLADYIKVDAKKNAIEYVLHTVTVAHRLKLKDPSGIQLLSVDPKTKPVVFPLNRWRHLMVSLRFTLEEPDMCNNLYHCRIFVGPSIPMSFLHGVKTLLQCLAGLRLHVIRSMMSLNEEDARNLALTIATGSESSSRLTRRIQPLWDQHRELLEDLGYKKIHKHHRTVLYSHSPGSGLFAASGGSSLRDVWDCQKDCARVDGLMCFD